MIDYATLQEIATKNKTTVQNVAREYCQNLFLSYLYKADTSLVERMLFKGGTALRIIYLSPRFSEDLDFSAFQLSKKEIEDTFISVLTQIEKEGVATKLGEAKETQGGYLGKALFTISDFDIEIMIQVHFKKGRKINGEVKLIANDFLPPYNLLMLPEEILVQEKVAATLSRAKPRDFYDIYFILRKNLLKAKRRGQLKDVLGKLEEVKINFTQELSSLLPMDQQRIAREFKKVLVSEISKYIPG